MIELQMRRVEAKDPEALASRYWKRQQGELAAH